MKEFPKALFALFFFQPYTVFGREAEICLGIIAWINLVLVIIALMQL